MSDDLERRLDRFYRGLDDSARRVEGKWRRQGLPRHSPRSRRGLFLAVGGAAAAIVLITLSLVRSDPEPSVAPPPLASRPPPRVMPQSADPAFPPPVRRPVEPRVAPPAPAAAPPVKPPPTLPTPEEPIPSPRPAPEPVLRKEVPKPDPAPTVAERARITLREVEGTFEIGERILRGRQKEFFVASGDRLKASSVVKVTLAEDRFLLLSPRTTVELRAEEKRLTAAIEVGDLHAELVGPGPEIRVRTRTCEVIPVGTVFTVRAEERKSTVTVERGRVEVRGTHAKVQARAGEAVQAAEDGALSAPGPADFRVLAWTRAHRPAESLLYSEDFTKPGAWNADLEKGAAKGLPAPGVASLLHLESEKPIFEVPLRGQIQILYRTDHASRLVVQFYVRDARLNFRKEVPLVKTPTWRLLTLDVEDFSVFDKSKGTGRPPAGLGVYDLGLYYGEEGDKGILWVSSIKVLETRP